MPPQQSSPKWEFLMALGLEENNESHQLIYKAMKDEAIEVWKAQLKGRRSTLKPEHADAREPWSSNMFTASAWNRAVAAICGSASARTRPMYAKGSMDGENWVARWALYHILRYRDDRNKRARSNKFHDDDDRHMQGPLGGPKTGPVAKPSGSYYDAARNNYRAV